MNTTSHSVVSFHLPPPPSVTPPTLPAIRRRPASVGRRAETDALALKCWRGAGRDLERRLVADPDERAMGQ